MQFPSDSSIRVQKRSLYDPNSECSKKTKESRVYDMPSNLNSQSDIIFFFLQGTEIVRFTCEINTISESQTRYIWDNIGVKAAIAEIQNENERIRFYAEISEEEKKYPRRFKQLIEERGVKVLGDIHPCGRGTKNAKAAYQSVIDGKGYKFLLNPERFNRYVVELHPVSLEIKSGIESTRQSLQDDTTFQKLASKTHPLLVDQLFDPITLREIEKWEEAEKSLKETEDDDEFEPAHEGTVYWADMPLLPGLIKNGGSRYDGSTRVHQLYTAGVPVPYVCRHEKKVSDWKLFEGVFHEYFKAFRVYKRKEFFSYSIQDAIKLTRQIEGLELFSEDEKVRWDSAMEKVSRRLACNRATWARKKERQASVSSTIENHSVKQLLDKIQEYEFLCQKLTLERDGAVKECNKLKTDKLAAGNV